MLGLRPIITICGTTGVGKSNLGVELALHLSRKEQHYGEWKGARIINADSMQVYSGMDIITNKMPVEERKGVEHLLIGFRQPGEQYTIGQWVDDTLKLIEETHQRKQIPILVGGTSYWIQHLLFPGRLAQDSACAAMSPELQQLVATLPTNLLQLYTGLPSYPPSAGIDPDAAFELHTLLTLLDPAVASRWHWKDTRKVLRSLCIIKETGRRPSEIMEEQSRDESKNHPRFNSLCLWLYAEPNILEARLNRRVDTMIEQGLLQEVRDLVHLSRFPDAVYPVASVSDDGGMKPSPNYTLGIYQAIGYKEFSKYLSLERPTEKDFAEAVDRMKLSTRQYAKRQVSWIKNKLLPAAYAASGMPEHDSVPIYLLDATGDCWTKSVLTPAFRILEDFLAERQLPDPISLSATASQLLKIDRKSIRPVDILASRRKVRCSVCTTVENRPVMIEEGVEWDAHRKTRIHKRMAKRFLDSDK